MLSAYNETETTAARMLSLVWRWGPVFMKKGGGPLVQDNDDCRPRNVRTRAGYHAPTPEEIAHAAGLARQGMRRDQIALAIGRSKDVTCRMLRGVVPGLKRGAKPKSVRLA